MQLATYDILWSTVSIRFVSICTKVYIHTLFMHHHGRPLHFCCTITVPYRIGYSEFMGIAAQLVCGNEFNMPTCVGPKASTDCCVAPWNTHNCHGFAGFFARLPRALLLRVSPSLSALHCSSHANECVDCALHVSHCLSTAVPLTIAARCG